VNIGYARCSTEDQHPENQIDKLVEAGCEKRHSYRDTASGGCWDRPELHKAINQLRDDDVLVVWKLDRLSRSLRDLILLMQQIKDKGAKFKSLTEAIDTTSACRELIMHVLAAFAQFERSIIRERTMAGLDRAHKKGNFGGGKFKLSKSREAHAIEQIKAGKTQREVAEDQDSSTATMSRLVFRARAKGLL
jgi:DNA invertase Pin-like site-specific DNA recombinase